MAKRPTPKQKRCQSGSGNRYGAFERSERRRLAHLRVSPFAVPAARRKKGDKALEQITKVQA